ncbi:MAG TPA: GFA family protein [Gammaproteobacteria bacterium]|nr:GFA family protein [Gammaproteobacteria bacterium]
MGQAYYEVRGGGGNRFSRGLCPRCGSAMFGFSSGFPELIGIRAGTLDDPGQIHPAVDIFTESAPHWDFMDPAILKFPRAPQAR